MNPSHLALLSVVTVFGGAALGIFLRALLPQHHLSAETKDTVKLSMGLVATMTALLLGWLVARRGERLYNLRFLCLPRRSLGEGGRPPLAHRSF